MESVEKQMVPLVDIVPKNDEFFAEKPSEKTAGPKRKLLLVLVIIAVVIVVILAVTLIAIYVPKYLSDAENERFNYTGPLTGELKVSASPKSHSNSSVTASSLPVVAEPSPTAQLSDLQEERTTSAPKLEPTSSSIIRARDVAALTAIENLVTNTVTASSLPVVAEPSPTAQLSDLQEERTTSAPKLEPTSSSIIRANDVTALTAIANLVTNTVTASSLPVVAEPSSTTQLSDLREGLTTSVPKLEPTSSSIIRASSVAALTVIAQLVTNTESKWSRWSSWSDCTKTCGIGSRYRNRKCLAINPRSVFAPITCAGKPDQIKPCAEWGCPDCSRNCTTGTLNAACDACTCDHHVVTGRVLTINGAPLSEANISSAETPYNVLAHTNISGHFKALGVCVDEEEMFVTKEGFVPVTRKANVLTPTTATINVQMEIGVPPFVTVHPKSKIRMPGQSVTFCCDGQGNPPPEIEWFKENNIIDKELYNYNNTLEITAEHGLNGSYRCRVVNDFGTEFSGRAILEIIEEDVDSCSSKPNSKNITLPQGCVVKTTGGQIVDVGECKPVPCLKNDTSFYSSCREPSFCCGPGEAKNVLVDCGSVMSFNVSKVTHCSCGSCIEKVTIIQGIVVGGLEETPVRYGDIIYDGNIVSYTDVKGRFSFEIPGNANRVAVTFTDSYYKEFEERTKIFLVSTGSSEFHKITLKQIPIPILFNARQQQDISLRSDPKIESFADLELPEESFLTEDGSVFRGNAKAIVSVTDSRNLSDVLSAPGDFTTTDEEGEEEILETFGMMKMKFEDENGKQLAMSKPMKVYLDPEKLNIRVQDSPSVPMKLYWLDEKTQRWREAGDFRREDRNQRRRKRSNRVFFVGTITPAVARHQLNFDLPDTRVAIRVTTDPPKAGVVVRVIRREGTVYRGYIEQSTTSAGLTCIPIWRNKECSLQAESNGKYMMPIQNNVENLPPYLEARIEKKNGDGGGHTIRWIEFRSKLNENSSRNSPVYKIVTAEEEKCKSSQNRPEGSQFTFEEPAPALAPEDFSILTIYKNEYWIPGSCYIKVKITDGYGMPENAMFAAESYKENDLKEGGKLGLHIQMSRDVSGGPNKIVCLQFSCPTDDQFTYVKIAPLTRNCIYNSTHSDLGNVQYPNCPDEFSRPVCPKRPPSNEGQVKWLWIPKSRNGQTIYKTFHGEGPRKDFGEARCLEGNQNFNERNPTTIDDGGYALEYSCR